MKKLKSLPALIVVFLGLLLNATVYAQRTATGVATVVNGFVVAITVTDGGSGYTSAPTVIITGGSGIGAIAIATLNNGSVDKIIVTDAGSGYTSTPTVVISAPPNMVLQAQQTTNLVASFDLSILQTHSEFTTPILSSEFSYFLLVSGRWGVGPLDRGDAMADAAWASKRGPDGNWGPLDVNRYPASSFKINGQAAPRPTPDEYRKDHVYTFPLAANNKSSTISFDDSPVSDNVGGPIHFELYQVSVSVPANLARKTSLSFDGVDNYALFANSFLNGQTLSRWSLEFWFKTLDINHNRTLARNGQLIWGKSGFWRSAWVTFQPDGTIHFNYEYPSPQTYHAVTSPPGVIKDKTWHHVAVVMDAAPLKLYVDGNLVGTSQENGNLDWGQDSGGASTALNMLGRSYDKTFGINDRFNGLISEFRIWNKALNATEIVANMKKELDPATNSELVGYWKMNEGSGTSARDSVGANSLTLYGATWANDGPPILPLGSSQPPSSNFDVSKGLVAYYPFNGNANDASGSGRNGTVIGATLIQDRNGVPNSAYSFDGVSQYISLPAITQLNGASAATISFWVNDNSATQATQDGAQAMFGHWTEETPQGGIYLTDYRADGVAVALLPVGDVIRPVVMPHLFNAWHHVLVVFDGSQKTNADKLRLYLDGSRIELTYPFSVLTTLGPGSSSSTLVGARHVRGVPGDFFNGKLDDLRIYNRALSAAEITALYQMESQPSPPFNPTTGPVAYYPFNGNANDESGNGHNGTISGSGITFVQNRFGVANSAAQFDGQGGQIELSSLDQIVPTTSQSATFSFWVKKNSVETVISKYDNSGGPNSSNFFVQIDPVDHLNVSGTGVDVFRPMLASSTKEWSQIVIVFKGGTDGMKAFQDGQLLGTGSLTLRSVSTSTKLLIGKVSGSPPGNLTGTIDDIRIYNRALSDAEVAALYQIESQPSPPTQLVNIFTTSRLRYSTLHGFRLSFSPPFRTSFSVETSADLKTWIPLLAFPTNAGPFEFIDSTALGVTNRFYRAVRP